MTAAEVTTNMTATTKVTAEMAAAAKVPAAAEVALHVAPKMASTFDLAATQR